MYPQLRVAALVAAFVVKTLPLYVVKWLVVVVVLLTEIQMLRSALAPEPSTQHSLEQGKNE